MSARCLEGHVSTELDYCSVCGAAMPVQTQPVLTSSVAVGAASCPACGEPRIDAASRFCEVCRFDFVANKAGPPPVGRAAPPLPSVPSSAIGPSVVSAWSLLVTVDPSLDVEPDPDSPCPANSPERVVAVDRDELLVGRHDDKRDIHPEISVRDPGASRRHAKFVRLADGALVLQDLASLNGTKLNGADVEAGSRRTLAADDEVTLGRWTRIKVRSAP
jgi:hypothetical protein